MPKALIVTALEVEYLAVREYVSSLQEQVDVDGTIYEIGTYGPNWDSWEVVLVQIGMGNTTAAILTSNALRFSQPDCALFIGVAGGIKDLDIGDVVAASKVYAYEFGKSEEEFKARAEVRYSSHPLIQRAQKVARDGQWLPDSRVRGDGTPFHAIVKPIAAGSQVVASTNSATYKLLREHYGDAVAVEMEGAGFLEAVSLSTSVSALVVRGISDLLDGKIEADKEGGQELASANAAAFAFEVLKSFKPLGRSGNEALPVDFQPLDEDVEVEIGPSSDSDVFGHPPRPLIKFAGRSVELTELRRMVSANSARTPKIMVIQGMSGSGKTQLCAEFLRTNRGDFSEVIWISDSVADSIRQELGAFALSRGLVSLGEDPLNREPFQIAIEWLERNSGWLVVLDDADPRQVGAFLPRGGQGSILITSTNPNWGAIATNKIELGGLDRDSALHFLVQRSGDDDLASAGEISDAFDCLPLALEQAASYVESTGISLKSYRALLEVERPALLETPSIFTEYPSSVYAALRLSSSRAASIVPEVGALMNYLAVLGPGPIPRSLVFDGLAHYFRDSEGGRWGILDFNRAVAQAAAGGLVSAEPEWLNVHSLERALVLDELGEEAREAWACFALQVLSDAFPYDPNDSAEWSKATALIDHVLVAFNHAPMSCLDDESIWGLMVRAGAQLHSLRRNAESLEVLQRAMADRIERSGEVTPDVGLVHINLAGVYKDLGDCSSALDSGSRAVEILSATAELQLAFADELGRALSNLGGIYLDCNSDTNKARELYQGALDIHESLFGRLSIAVATDLNNLGAADRAEGNWAAALERFLEAVAINRQVVSADDRRLAVGLYNVGTAAFNTGNFDLAREALSESAEIVERLRGNNIDGELIGPLGGLAQTLRFLGRPAEAVKVFDRVIPIAVNAQGESSDEVVQFRANRGAAAYEAVKEMVS